MCNPLHRAATDGFARRAPVFIGCATALLLLGACGGRDSAPAGEQPPAATASANVHSGQVVITGAVSKSYTPEVSAVKIADNVGINLNVSEVCGVALQFPIDIAPGQYPMGDPIKQLGDIKAFGDYTTPTCEEDGSLGDTFRSTGGALTLTATGGKYSGNFDFTAAKMNDQSKTIHVTGSFRDVPFP